MYKHNDFLFHYVDKVHLLIIIELTISLNFATKKLLYKLKLTQESN
jgi:hypothetical protein